MGEPENNEGPTITLSPHQFKQRLTNPKSGWAQLYPPTQEEIDSYKWCPEPDCNGWQWDNAHPWCYRHCIEHLGEAEVERLREAWKAANPEKAEESRKRWGPFTDEEKAEMEAKWGWVFKPTEPSR